MKSDNLIVGVTHRVYIDNHSKEFRDALDHRLVDWISDIGLVPLPIPNSLAVLEFTENNQLKIYKWLSALNLDALVLSGGNNIGDFPKRDLTENALLSWAEKNKVPVFGVCRGMQMMGVYAGSKLKEIDKHVGVMHQLQSNEDIFSNKKVNSYHNFILEKCPYKYRVVAKSEDGGIEAIRHKTLPWEAWMWHPERDEIIDKDFKKRFTDIMKTNKPKVIILAAGEGIRLRPYTEDRPKCMVKIEGVSLLDRQLKVLKSENLHDIVVVGGYKSNMLRKGDFRLKNNLQYYETNMLWTLFCADEELTGGVIVSYGDIVFSKKTLQKLLESTNDISVVIDKDWEVYWRERNEDLLADAETLKLRSDGTIKEIGKKPKSLDEIEGQYMGLMKFSTKGVEQLRKIYYSAVKDENILGKSVKVAYMTDILQAIIDHGISINAVPVHGEWVEIDTVSDLKISMVSKRLKKIHNDEI